MNKLYLVVIDWTYLEEKQEAEWIHFVHNENDHRYAEKIAKDFLVSEDNLLEDIQIDNLWINEVSEVDGYNIELKEKK